MGKRSKKKLQYQTRTPLSGHKKEGKVLKPPFVQFGVGKGLVSWTNDRLPEMAWAALLIAKLGRNRALETFRTFLRLGANDENSSRFWDPTLTGFSQLAPADRREVLGLLCQTEELRGALAPLLLFSALPARYDWQEALQNAQPGPAELLMEAVRLTLFHQSQEATDCRWVRLMSAVFGKRVIIPHEELIQLNGYPRLGDQTHVRPSIRAAEGAMDAAEKRDLTWPNAFWAECWEKTPCLGLRTNEHVTESAAEAVDLKFLQEIRRELESHWENTRETTAIDARHDAVFGMAFYALRLMEEVVTAEGGAVVGRLALRTLLETRLTLHYLLKEDKLELWRTWRNYGVGQAKLASLKLEKLDPAPPNYLDGEVLNRIANEDFWEEFVAIDVGHWAGSDLRKMSEKIGLKDVYDRYYGWTSGFSHGQWGPIRESVFVLCLNPLHRGHRIPKPQTPPSLPKIKDDAIELFDSILAEVDKAYSAFSRRCKS